MINLLNSAISLLLAESFLFSTGTAALSAGKTAQACCVQTSGRREVFEREAVPFVLRSPAGERQAEISVTYCRKGDERQEIRREWSDAEDEVFALCRKNACAAEDATVTFNADGFTYTPERKGIYCDYRLSLSRALAAMEAGERESGLVCREYEPKVTLEQLKARTQRLSSFTTYFDGGNAPRVHNIALAASRIAGTVVAPHAEFSFNRAAGKRTEENGYEVASVIFDGAFVPGVGGGVCQASTTLMNAALYAGLHITESRPHSLSIGYVPPSLDAMVSEYSDLKFVNPYDFPVYLAAKTGSNFVRFTFYGLPDGKRYETESVVLRRIAPPPAQITEGAENKTVRAEKEGLASESYLLVYGADGALLSRTLLRRDTYGALQGIYEVAPNTVAPPETDSAQKKEGEDCRENLQKNSENP